MTELRKLKNDPNNRIIRDIVMSGGETIKIYEPTSEQVDEILSFQEKWIDGNDLNISGSELVTTLFPILTDIRGIKDMTNEEIDEVIENPSLALMQVQNHVETIVTEIYKTVILNARKKLLEADFSVESYKINEETFDRAIGLAAKESGASNLAEKLEKATDEVIDADKRREKNRIVALKEYKNSTEEKINKYQKMIDEKRAQFNSADDEDKID